MHYDDERPPMLEGHWDPDHWTWRGELKALWRRIVARFQRIRL